MYVFCLPAVALAHLDDYENACKSYEQALTLDRYTLTPLDLQNHYITPIQPTYPPGITLSFTSITPSSSTTTVR